MPPSSILFANASGVLIPALIFFDPNNISFLIRPIYFLPQKNETSKHEKTFMAVDGVSRNGHLGGARIGIVAKPSAEFVAGILGAWLCGGVAVPLALSYPEAELLHVMNDSVCPTKYLLSFSLFFRSSFFIFKKIFKVKVVPAAIICEMYYIISLVRLL